MAIPILDSYIVITSLIALVLFFLSSGSALSYTKTFYGDRPVPRSWLLIVMGIVINAIAEAGELGVFVEVIFWNIIPGIPEGMIELAAHAIAGIILAIGGYMLWKEIP